MKAEFDCGTDKAEKQMLRDAPEGSAWLLEFISNVKSTLTGSASCYSCHCLLVSHCVLRTSLFFSFFPRVLLANSCCWSSCSEAAVRRLNTSVPTGGSREATLAFCSPARTSSSPCSRFLAEELSFFLFLLMLLKPPPPLLKKLTDLHSKVY